MRRRFGLLAALASGVLLLGSGSVLGETRAPAVPTAWVTDRVGFLSPGTVQALNEELRSYEARSGHQVVVWIDRTTEGVPIEDWAARTFEAWGIGRKGFDDGVAVFLFTEDRSVRIEVGYGLEGEIPDAVASRILREEMTPRLQAGDNDGALRATVRAIRAALGDTEAQSEPTQTQTTYTPTTIETIGSVLLGIAFLILLIIRPRWALWLLFSILRGGGGRGGSGGGFGGGFSGKGGRSGGGGASGSW